ncbi:MAG: hypothetical protein NTY88_02565 [Bacteroidetes bacterium]|nr:hypothetical protein [Bacteroidota bacterium]
MNKAVVLIFLALSIFYLGGCTKDKTAAPPACTQADTLNTYTKSVKSILDNQCALSGCHDAATASLTVILDDYSHSVTAAKTNPKFFCVMDFTCTPHMPQGFATPIDASEINAIKRWRDNCYPQ